MASPSNNRGGNKRPTGGKAGGRAGKPTKPIAGTRDKTVRVPASWNAQVVDPTNNRGAGQRPTGGQAGGRAGRPSGSIARPKPASASVPQAAAASTAKAAAKAGLKGAASKALVLPAIAAQGANVAGGFNKLANHPFVTKNQGKPSGGNGGSSQATPRRTGQNSSNVNFQTTPGAGRRVNPSAAKPKTSGGGGSPTLASRMYETLYDTQASRSNYGLDKAKAPDAPKLPPPARATSSRAAISSGSSARMPSSVTRSSAPKAPAAPAKPTERRVSASTANRESGNYGTSKTNNPLMKDMVGRMKDREDKAQASSASKLTSKFNTESNFSGEKLDGSKYLDSLKRKKKS